MEIQDASDLRQGLSEELHARAFYDFDGAGRFIRFVYLVGNDDSAVLNYVNDYLQTFGLPTMQADEKRHSTMTTGEQADAQWNIFTAHKEIRGQGTKRYRGMEIRR